MDTKAKIKACADSGGAWGHLKELLIQEGMSKELADDFIRTFRKKLGGENAGRAVPLYSQWLGIDDKKQAEAWVRLQL